MVEFGRMQYGRIWKNALSVNSYNHLKHLQYYNNIPIIYLFRLTFSEGLEVYMPT